MFVLVDKEIIEECKKGDMARFRELVEISSPYAYAVAFRLMGDEDMARDIVQESMVRIWQTISTIESPEKFRSWLYRIVVNRCYDEMRRKKRIYESRADESAWAKITQKVFHNPSEILENKEIASLIGRLTEKMSRKQKTVFILADIEGLTSDEIKEITGMSKSGIKANLHLARKWMAEAVIKYL